jgi:peptidoglycan/xylan/chitin deacetylase (PgdA/CDA1 family)
MYHKVSADRNDNLTISQENLEVHFRYLSSHGYSCLPLSYLLEKEQSTKPGKMFALTFDDAYVNNLDFLYPLLKKYDFHCTIMLPVGFLGKTNAWDNGNEPIMNFGQLLSMDSRYVSFGLHTYKHESLLPRSSSEISTDITKCRDELSRNGIPYLPVIAYPYGAYPKDKVHKAAFIKMLEQLGITYGLRIGNRVNKWPIKNPYEVKRIDIKGGDSLWTFKTKLKKGRVKMF